MGGPSVSISLALDPLEDDRLKLWRTLKVLGERAPEGQEWPDIWFHTTRPIGGSYDGEGRPFGVTWSTAEFYPGEDEDSPTRRRDIAERFGMIVGVPYRTEGGRTWVTHFCDAEFMEAWLHHPDFHMIK